MIENHSVTTNPLTDMLYHEPPCKDPGGDDAAVLGRAASSAEFVFDPASSEASSFPGFWARHIRNSLTLSRCTEVTSKTRELERNPSSDLLLMDVVD